VLRAWLPGADPMSDGTADLAALASMPVERLLEHDPLQLGPYKILARLGSGGMGAVYLGETKDGAAAAVKVVKPELARDPEFRARFTREVEAGRRVAGRCVARFLDADLAAEAPWLATEYVAGPTLDVRVEGEGPQTGQRLLALAVGLADALVSIHGAGLVHRDLKPSNVVLADDAPKVIDFGVVSAGDSAALTTTGSLVGSPAYMSPEQAEGRRDVGPAADVFSWASCVVYAARGEPPFGRGEAAGMLYKVVHQPADLDGVPADLAPVLRAALDKDPAARPTATQLLETCVALASGQTAPDLAVPVSVAGAAVATGAAAGLGSAATGVLAASWAAGPRDPDAAERTIVRARDLRASLPSQPDGTEPKRRSRRGLLVAGLAALLLLGALAGALLLRPEPKTVLATGTATGGDTTTTTAAPGGAADTTTTAPVTAGSPVPEPGAAPTTVAGTPGTPGAPGTTAAPAVAGPAAGPATGGSGGGGAVKPPTAGPAVPTTAPRAVQLIVDDTSNSSTVKAVYNGAVWTPSDYVKAFHGSGYRTSDVTMFPPSDQDPFTFSFLVREGEQLQRTVEAMWTVARPGDPISRNPAVPFIIRNASGVQLGRVDKDQRVGQGTWNPIGRYTFSAGWNTVQISRMVNPALGEDLVADAVRITP